MDKLIDKRIINKVKATTILLFIMLLFNIYTECYATERYKAPAMIPKSDTQITINSVNLTAEKFFKSYMSDSADERKKAELYLLGVMDATEGKSWCDYSSFKTITLRERIYENFKRLNGHQLNKRASEIIEHILSSRYPCGRKK